MLILEHSLGHAKKLFPSLQPMKEPSGKQEFKAQQARDWAPADVYHISLSRTVPVKHHQIESLIEMLKENFRGQKR
jgi:hypothetical protein